MNVYLDPSSIVSNSTKMSVLFSFFERETFSLVIPKSLFLVTSIIAVIIPSRNHQPSYCKVLSFVSYCVFFHFSKVKNLDALAGKARGEGLSQLVCLFGVCDDQCVQVS